MVKWLDGLNSCLVSLLSRWEILTHPRKKPEPKTCRPSQPREEPAQKVTPPKTSQFLKPISFYTHTPFIRFMGVSRTQLLFFCWFFFNSFRLPQLPLLIRITSCFSPRFPPTSPCFCLFIFFTIHYNFFLISSQRLSPISPSVPTFSLLFLFFLPPPSKSSHTHTHTHPPAHHPAHVQVCFH